jgi:hypothetical protein
VGLTRLSNGRQPLAWAAPGVTKVDNRITVKL